MSRVVLPSIQLGETRTLSFDFTSRMSVGETIAGQACTAGLFSGVDGAPSAVISGVATASGAVVSQNVVGTVEGCVYDIKCVISTSLGQTLIIGGYLACNPRPV
jgi:hypothetical protein